jgi:hypothetical protein
MTWKRDAERHRERFGPATRARGKKLRSGSEKLSGREPRDVRDQERARQAAGR